MIWQALGVEVWVPRATAAPLPAPLPAPAAQSEPSQALPSLFEPEKPDLKPEATPVVLPAEWPALAEVVKACQACKLCHTRQNTVFGAGNMHSSLMIIGEGPGADEDASGQPFVGKAGQLLNQMLASLGLNRDHAQPERSAYITNVVKCRPPLNRDPEADEVEACRGYLDQQIALVRPKLIVALGRVAAQRLLQTDSALGHLRGKVLSYASVGQQVPVIVTYHPAYLLRSPREKEKSWADLKQIWQTLQTL
jgi:DNA polymerase